jgi:hypothetical protein
VPYAGTFRWNGEDICTLKGARLAQRIGVLSQKNTVSYAYTVEEVVALGRYAYKAGLFSGRDDRGQARVEKALEIMRRKISTEPIGFRLLPSLFTLTQLQKLYEAVNGEELDKRNFRKRIKEMDFIEKTELIDKVSSKRGASLYRFNKKAFNEYSNFKL